jgi:hypothetical protein
MAVNHPVYCPGSSRIVLGYYSNYALVIIERLSTKT